MASPEPKNKRQKKEEPGLKKILLWEETAAEEARSQEPLKWEEKVMEDAWYQEEREREREGEREIREIVYGAGN